MSPVNDGDDDIDGTINIRATVTSSHDESMHGQNSDINLRLDQQVNETTSRIVEAFLSQNNTEQNWPTEIRQCVANFSSLGDMLNAQLKIICRPLKSAPIDGRYEQFVRISHELFRSGINWGKIAILFCFSVEFVKLCARSYVGETKMFLIQFIGEKLQRWIVESGGWSAVQDFVDDMIERTSSARVMKITLSVCCMMLVAYYLLCK